jgi:ABC-type sugar transport system permease subunit
MMKTKKKKYRSIEQLKSRYGLGFTAIWVIGFILFFAYPLVQSIWYSFCDVTLSADGVATQFIGFKNYDYALNAHPNFTTWMTADLSTILYSLPIILLVSLVLALLLNQKFKGRVFFRAVYFVPVIIASGVVLTLMFQTTSEDLTSAGVSVAISDSMFSIEDVIGWLSLPDSVAQVIKMIINNIFDLLWSCGIQTVLFISGLQSIPRTLYEASKVESATKWEEFWFITFPSLGSVTLLVAVYTMVDIFTDSRNTIIAKTYGMINSGNYDETSAMLWIYFVLVGVIMGAILFLYNRFLLKRWS